MLETYEEVKHFEVRDGFLETASGYSFYNTSPYTFEELCQIKSSKKIYASDYVENGVPFYRGKEITELSSDSQISEEMFISYEKYNKINEQY